MRVAACSFTVFAATADGFLGHHRTGHGSPDPCLLTSQPLAALQNMERWSPRTLPLVRLQMHLSMQQQQQQQQQSDMSHISQTRCPAWQLGCVEAAEQLII